MAITTNATILEIMEGETAIAVGRREHHWRIWIWRGFGSGRNAA